jgi:DNA-binding GntR family transcriptional regulator
MTETRTLDLDLSTLALREEPQDGFLATFYGVAVANIAYLPIANALKKKTAQEAGERMLIIEGVLAPGAHLNERILCEQLQVSRTPLREAFRTLAGEGVIDLMPNRGAVVAALSRDDLEHAFELMTALEGLAGELAAKRATPAEVRRIRSLQAEMTQAHSRRDLPAYYRLNRAIHALIVGLAGNPMLTESYSRLNARLQAVRFRSNLNREKWDAALAEHAAMADALAARDGARLAALLRAHLAPHGTTRWRFARGAVADDAAELVQHLAARCTDRRPPAPDHTNAGGCVGGVTVAATVKARRTHTHARARGASRSIASGFARRPRRR